MNFDENEGDPYADFDEYDPNFDTQALQLDTAFQAAVENTRDKRPPPTAARLKTGVKKGFLVPPSSMGVRPITGSVDASGARPMTAVRAAGYTKGCSDVRLVSGKAPPVVLKKKTLDTPEEKVKDLERTINKLINESCMANSKRDYQIALEKAYEAERKEKLLVDLKKRLIPNNEQVNLDLNYAVKFNLANQQAANNMDNEAIATFQSLVKNKTFSHSGRLKVNIGNIHFKMRQYDKAVKFYKMALDQVSNEYKNMNTKIKQNICVAYVKMNMYQDAATVLELIMDQEPTFKTSFNLTLCYYLLNDADMMKRTFERMLTLESSFKVDEDKYAASSDDKQHNFLLEAIRDDELRKMEKDKTGEAESCLMMAAKIISGSISTSYAAGYDWCINQVKSSTYMNLAHDLEIDKAIGFLKQKDFQQAIETLKSFERKDPKVASAAATNLSFLYNLENELKLADKYAEVALHVDRYNPSALVNKGNVLLKKGDLEKSIMYYTEALDTDRSCVEALYNLGLTNKRLGRLELALDCFTKLHSILKSHPQVMFQLADICAQKGDIDQAKEWLMHVNSMVPSDPIVIQRLAEIFEGENDNIQALHYYSESYKFDPTNINTLEWMGSYFIESQVPENAIQYFEKGAYLQPGQAKWPLRIASCYRKIGSYQQALELYKHVHRRFPDNIECLKILTKFCVDMDLKDAKFYTDKLKEAEKSHQLREERASSGRQRSAKFRHDNEAGGNDSRQSSGSLRSSDQSRKNSANSRVNQKPPTNDGTYSDPLGPQIERPRTAARRHEQQVADDFEDEEIGDDLLPE
ncbi:hypothetical protein HELRODRAFT_79910 [Helobdella robusta]|uniref:Intraflagellar transport protein 88 homolog n=1 Tax=Helobdella robusta TaxID=6412 RepID=T1G3V1_HELRO|nr:hypothetical protein HELRODRAFT_79910 [Helobdella robusta]ESO03760.1 hypothetical protein HELRODRAFT_79910 [Helobdella robusta]